MWHNRFMKKWVWQIYSFFITSIVFSSLPNLINKTSSLRMYYTILLPFDIRYTLFFYFNIISLLINLLIPLIVVFYALNIRSSVKFWQIFFFVRIFFDLVGHQYDNQIILSAFSQNFSYGLANLSIFLIPFIPSYIAHFLYAFRNSANLKPK